MDDINVRVVYHKFVIETTVALPQSLFLVFVTKAATEIYPLAVTIYDIQPGDRHTDRQRSLSFYPLGTEPLKNGQ